MFATLLPETALADVPLAKVPKSLKGSDLMANLFKTLFFIRKEKTDKAKNLSPIYLRITCGKRVELSLGKFVAPEKWNAEKQMVTGSSPEARAINAYLKSVEVRLHEVHRALFERGDIITAEVLKARLQGKGEHQKTLFQAVDYYLGQMKIKLGKGYSQTTINKYEYLRRHLDRFILQSTCATDIYLSKVDLFLIKGFQAYLMTDRTVRTDTGRVEAHKGCEHNAALKYMKMLRTIINAALAFGWIESDPFLGFKEKFEDVEQEYLNEEELRQLMSKEIANQRLSVIRDVFVFCCFTGLAYSDVEKLSPEHIVVGIDSLKWIEINRTKTNTLCRIPLLPVAESILLKYGQHPVCLNTGRLLPVCSNQKFNAYLKEIGDICGLSQNLTCHVARRTFSTVAGDLGVPAETIVKIIGHKGFKHLHLYNKTGLKKISSDVDVLRNKTWGEGFVVDEVKEGMVAVQ